MKNDDDLTTHQFFKTCKMKRLGGQDSDNTMYYGCNNVCYRHNNSWCEGDNKMKISPMCDGNVQ
jgi:hypothetical protein